MAIVMQLSICLLVFVCNFGLGSFERTSKKIYIPISHVQGCFRRLNATHQIGCSSKMGGNIGVIHNIETDADLEWIIEYGPHAPYIPVMSSINFNVTNVKRLKDSGKISGILVSHILSNDSISPFPADGFSPAHSCPLDAFGMYQKNSEYGDCKQVTWNPVGSSLMYEDLGIPIFVILNITEYNWLINDCYEKFNKPTTDGKARPYPLCSAELKSAMYAAKDSVTCIRRTKHMVNLNVDQYCDPLGDQNVYATVKETRSNETQPDASVILVAARIDAFTLFEQTTPSADNDVTGLVALLAAAHALSESGMIDEIHNSTTAKDIMFTFFQGEAFDYIGSSRMVYEMEKNRFPEVVTGVNTVLHPINLTHISHLLEVNQLGLGPDLWLHSDPITANSSTFIATEVQNMKDSLESFGSEYDIQVKSAAPGQPLPPASVQRFLMKHALPTIVMTDHQKEFTNQYYQSRFDVSDHIQVNYPSKLNKSEWYDFVTPQAKRLADRAGLLAQFLYYLSTGEKSFIPANSTLVTNLLYCFLFDGTCDLFKTVLDKADAGKLKSHPYPFYVSVARNTNHVSVLTKKLLAYFLGSKVKASDSETCKEDADKDKLYSFIWMQGPADENSTRAGICIKSTAGFSEAKSPVFLEEMDDYNWASGEYSSWTESTWDTFSVRLFLVPSKQFQTATLSSGVILLLVSLVIVYFLNSNALTIFSPNSPSDFY